MFYLYVLSSAGFSQETDSDGESIRSDTKTIKSASEMNGRNHGDTRSVSTISSSDSNHSDVEVDRSRKVYSRAMMSTSYCQVSHC